MWRFPPSYRIIMAKENNKRNPLSGIIAGIALLVIGTCILWLNEGDYVANMKAVKDVSENVIDISSETVDASNNGKLVCLSGGFVIPDELVEDSLFSVGTKTAKLERIVEVYQWRESQDSDNNYTYDKEWSEDLIDSSDFHNTGHSNPGVKEVENESFCVSQAEIGAFKLSEDQLKNLRTKRSRLTRPQPFRSIIRFRATTSRTREISTVPPSAISGSITNTIRFRPQPFWLFSKTTALRTSSAKTESRSIAWTRGS